MKLVAKIFIACIFLNGFLVHAQEPLPTIKDVQTELAKRGYDVGGVDGIFGQNTSRALSEFQHIHDLEVTGNLNAETAQALGTTPYLKLQAGQSSSSRSNTRQVSSSQAAGDGGIAWYWWILGVWLVWRFLKKKLLGNQSHTSPGTQTVQHRDEWEEDEDGLYDTTMQETESAGQEENDQYWTNLETSGSYETSSSKTSADYKKEGDKCWIPKGQPVTIGGKTISLGMLYVGKTLKPQRGYNTRENCLINSKAKVAQGTGGYHDEYMPYWPSYSQISPYSRMLYLDWLAGGAKDPNIYIGFVFLYFYGLERRLFLEQSLEDAKDIISEFKRLMKLYGSNHSFSRYCRKALSFSELITGKEVVKPPLAKPEFHPWELPLNIQIYIGKKLKTQKTISNDDWLLWFFNHPEAYFRTPARRLEKEFLALLRIRLAEKNPDGLKISRPKKNLSPTYAGCSNTFEADLTKMLGEIPDISGLKAPIRKAQEIADEVMDELDPLSRLIGRDPNAAGTFKAAQFLPGPLMDQFGGPKVQELKAWLNQLQLSEGGTLRLKDLIDKLSIEWDAKLTKTNHKTIEGILSNLGWTMIPGPEELIGSLNADHLVFVAPMNSIGFDELAKDPPYQLALLELTLGAYIAHSDGHVSEPEIDSLLHYIEVGTKGLKKRQKSRLHLFMKWLVVQQPDFGALRRKLKKADLDLRHSFAQLALASVGADGKIDPGEIKALEIIYKDLKLDAQALFSDLHALAGGAPKTMVGLTPGLKKESGDKTGKATEGQRVVLNRDRIQATMENTSKASKLLSIIFEEEEPAKPEEQIVPTEDVDEKENNVFNGLEREYTQLLRELLERNEWTRDEYIHLASSLKLMPDGALEAINEWAFDQFDEAIVENDNPIVVNRELLENRG